MNIKVTTPRFKPKCPNHGEELMGCGFPLPTKGIGKCPVSGVDFEFEVEVDETKTVQDKDGNIQKVVGWKVEGND